MSKTSSASKKGRSYAISEPEFDLRPQPRAKSNETKPIPEHSDGLMDEARHHKKYSTNQDGQVCHHHDNHLSEIVHFPSTLGHGWSSMSCSTSSGGNLPFATMRASNSSNDTG